MRESNRTRWVHLPNPLVALAALLLGAACSDASGVGFADDGTGLGDPVDSLAAESSTGEDGSTLLGDTNSSTADDALLDGDELDALDTSDDVTTAGEEVDTSTSLLSGGATTPEPDGRRPRPN